MVVSYPCSYRGGVLLPRFITCPVMYVCEFKSAFSRVRDEGRGHVAGAEGREADGAGVGEGDGGQALPDDEFVGTITDVETGGR